MCVCRNIKQQKNIEKTYQKPFQNEVRTMKKSMPKTCCFLTSIFWGSGLDLGASWASNLEPSWLKIAISSMLTCLFLRAEFRCLEKLRFRWPLARFWRLQASISKGFGTDFSKMFDVFWAPLVSYQRFKFIAKSGQIVAKMWAFISPCAFSNAVLQMQAFNAWQSPNILAHKWGGGGGPPWGEFNGIGAKLAWICSRTWWRAPSWAFLS